MITSYRNLLFAALCFTGCGVTAWAALVRNAWVGDPSGARLATAVLFLGFFGGVYFLIHALPGRTGAGRPPLTFRFVPSPEVGFEFSAAEGADPVAVPADAVRAALAAGFGFTLEDDPGGWVRLRGTIGPPRWTRDASGEVVGGPQYARLTLRTGADPAALRPDDVRLVSTEPNLTKNVSVALAAAFGPIRVRVCGDSVWLPVSADGLFSLLAVRLLVTQPPAPLFRDGQPGL